MATLTWIGGGNNSAGNPKDWSGDTTPKPSDTLILSNGSTINVTGNQLQGDTLKVRTRNLKPNEQVVV